MTMTSPPSASQPPGRSVMIPGTRIRGDIDAPGVLEIQGHVIGHVGADTVVVAEAGHVEGEIKAQSVTILGRLDGMVDTGALRLHSSAQVDGTLNYDTVAIDAGATITASLARRPQRRDPVGASTGTGPAPGPSGPAVAPSMSPPTGQPTGQPAGQPTGSASTGGTPAKSAGAA